MNTVLYGASLASCQTCQFGNDLLMMSRLVAVSRQVVVDCMRVCGRSIFQ